MSRARSDHLDLARTDLTRAADLFTEAVARANDARLGTVAASAGIGATGSGGSSSPVERAVIGSDCTCDGDDHTCRNGTTPDPARADLLELDKRLRRLGADAAWLLSFCRGYAARGPTSKNLREVAALNRPDDGCEHHAAVGIYEQADGPTGTVSGNLTTPMRLCGFCYRETYRKGVLPRGEVLVERHHKGKQPKEYA